MRVYGLNCYNDGTCILQWTGRAGLTLTGTLNYKVMPEVNSEVCYKQSQIRVKNCIGVYHQWTDNKLDLYAWYSWRGWCGWWVSVFFHLQL